jgi:hypothetical protein
MVYLLCQLEKSIIPTAYFQTKMRFNRLVIGAPNTIEGFI